ncbi:FAD/NAD(P)-binding domain-containing protein [Eremomyces bilateralis CBS 781.70]|uniref:FAD/NAD(P)-binding domain-containing protein n=1 Tax=Eremomyces bilateralis CBS 781.70 TaxID=1392243 RepID=A0A6G1GAQ9_9PEZI|nr:FAD/NAD(P)-binding domain-containing protein [Eremomyces bilateralis CBS 781.70]KAF1815026.1 FAD/NAD(P)-binding domain-containing protein [Eremomyces bilateralis CBS 781.70]
MDKLHQDLLSSRNYAGSAQSINERQRLTGHARDPARKPRVLIVGAGVSGLRCADVLLASGVDVTIYEARNRIGGRLAQASLRGHTVDLGPNWIHGIKDNPIMQLISKTSTAVYDVGEEQAIWQPDGKRMSKEDVEYYWNFLSETLDAASKYSRQNSSQGILIPLDMSLMDWITLRSLEQFRHEGYDEAAVKAKTAIVTGLATSWGNIIGEPISCQSLRYFWMEENLDGDNLFVAGTYEDVLQEIAKPANDNGIILFGKDVVRIYTPRNDESDQVIVLTADQEEEEFDDVIVTCPLGWLKHNKRCFSPALPKKLEQAIDSLGYGCLDKIYITFPEAFWNGPPCCRTSTGEGEGSSSDTPTSSASTSSVTRTELLTRPMTDTAPELPTILSWTSPSYARDTNPGKWSQEAINLANLPNHCSHPTLLFYIHGPCSRYIAHLLRSNYPTTERDASSDQVDSRLFEFLRPYISKLPNYDPSSPSCQPLATLATLWTADPLSGYGSYTNFPVELFKGEEKLLLLRGELRTEDDPHDGEEDGGAEVMARRGVWLAGEHTAPIIAVGTVAGAYLAGENVARKLLATLGMADGGG